MESNKLNSQQYDFKSKMMTVLIFQILIFYLFIIPVHGGDLTIRTTSRNSACLFYGDEPVHAFGPSPQNILTYLPKGNGNNISDWVDWTAKFGTNHVRSYPPSIKVSEPAQNIFEKSNENPKKFDLDRYNQKYFDELRKACQFLRENGFIVHLQLWQAVYWKRYWGNNYYNPKNNINPDISKHAAPKEFVTMKNSILLNHQKQYVIKILDATGDLGNVFYDIMNEIGNGTGISEHWVWEIIKTITEWEARSGYDVLVTLNDEGGKRMGNFSLECPGLDLVIKDLGRYDEHIEAKLKYNKPSISVRNIDYNYEKNKRFYFFGKNNLEVNTDKILQTRGRKYWWRMFIAGVQFAGGYADSYFQNKLSWYVNKASSYLGMAEFLSYKKTPSYRLNLFAEENFVNFKKFVNRIPGYQHLMPSSGVLIGHPVKNSYILQSENQAIIYIESPNGEAGFNYSSKQAKLNGLMLPDGIWFGSFYFPATGKSSKFTIRIKSGESDLKLPAFQDDLAIRIKQ